MRRGVRAAAVAGMMCLVTVACGQAVSPGEATGSDSDAFWDSVRVVGASEVLGPMDPVELAGESDAVVVGRFTGRCDERTFQGDAPQDVVIYGCVVLTIDEYLTGRDFGGAVEVEFLGGGPSTGVPDGDVLVFLIEKGELEPGKFRAASSYGLWAHTSRAVLDQPMREEVPSSGEPESRDALEAATDVDELAAWLGSQLG